MGKGRGGCFFKGRLIHITMREDHFINVYVPAKFIDRGFFVWMNWENIWNLFHHKI